MWFNTNMSWIFVFLLACGGEKNQDFSLGPQIEPSDEDPDTEDTSVDAPDTDTGFPQDTGPSDTAEDDTGNEDTDDPPPVDPGNMGELISTISLGNNGDGYGYRVASLGDNNFDGRSELALAAPTLVRPEFNTKAGGVSVFQASAESTELTDNDQLAQVLSDQAHVYFGQWISACDVDNDGRSELFIGSPNYTVNEEMVGAVFRYDLPITGDILSSSHAHLIYGEEEYGAFGGMVACSEMDNLVAVGAGYASPNNLEKSGRVYIYDPAFNGIQSASTAQAVIDGDSTGQYFGISQSFGDFNGDGFDDIIISGSGEGPSGDGTGTAAAFFGPLIGNLDISDADKTYHDQDPTDRLGNCVTAGEDVDGDGYGDYMISAYWRSTHAPRGGEVRLYGGGTSLPNQQSEMARFIGETEYGYGGISTAFLADYSNDGSPDIAIGEYAARTNPDDPASAVGAVRIFLGPPSGTQMLSSANQTLWGEGGAFGYHIAAVEDADGDNLTDLLVGAYTANDSTGKSYLFSGGNP